MLNMASSDTVNNIAKLATTEDVGIVLVMCLVVLYSS